MSVFKITVYVEKIFQKIVVAFEDAKATILERLPIFKNNSLIRASNSKNLFKMSYLTKQTKITNPEL